MVGFLSSFVQRLTFSGTVKYVASLLFCIVDIFMLEIVSKLLVNQPKYERLQVSFLILLLGLLLLIIEG